MSTRCQVKVTQEGLYTAEFLPAGAIAMGMKPKQIAWTEEITLYHHTDGYHEYMLPIILKAYQYKFEHHYEVPKDTDYWRFGRSGKVASLLCWADPAIFEPEASPELHGDIEYYYIIHAVNIDGKTKPIWEVEIYEPTDGFWDNPCFENLKITQQRKPIDELVKALNSSK